MTEVLIIGCGGHGQQIRRWMDAEARYRAAGWLDADPTKTDVWLDGLQVMGLPFQRPETPVVLGVGWDCRARMNYFSKRRRCVNVIHPSSVVPGSVRERSGLVVGPLSYVDGTATVGDAAVFHVSSAVHHHVVVGAGSFIGPGAVVCGHVHLGHRVRLGANATILPGIRIGDDATIGAGVTITKDVPAGETMIQQPAISMEHHEHQRQTDGVLRRT